MSKSRAQKKAEKLALKFREVRESKGLSQNQVALKTGMSHRSIGMIENQQRIPTIVTCLKICEALEIDLSELLKKLN